MLINGLGHDVSERECARDSCMGQRRERRFSFAGCVSACISSGDTLCCITLWLCRRCRVEVPVTVSRHGLPFGAV